jgi:phage terminase large subunit
MSPDESTIFIDYEAHGMRTEIDDIPALFDEIPGSREWPIIADSARPETISYLGRKGFHITGAEKGKGSIEDGITFLQSKTIIIHPRCKNTLAEFKTHKFRRHSQTNVILPKTEDAGNHHIDGLRYAYEGKWMKARIQICVI